MLDKFIGDGVMALFGVLNHKTDGGQDDAKNAILAAFQLRDRFDELVEKWTQEWKLYTPQRVDIGIGCGIHTGKVLAGNVGTEFRDQFTALGPDVNFAARIEGRSKHREVILSQTTEQRVKDIFNLESAGKIDDVKNIAGDFELFRAVDVK